MKTPLFICISCCFVGMLCITNNLFSQDAHLSADTLAARRLLEKEPALVEEEAYTQALDAVEQARDIYLGHQLWEDAIKCASRLSELADHFDEADIKIQYAEDALRLTQSHLPKDHILAASVYRQKAEALMLTDESDAAISYLELAGPIFKQAASWTNLGWTEILLGINYYYLSQLDLSIQHLRSAGALLDRELIPLDDVEPVESTLLYLFGIIYDLQGDTDNAIENTRLALEIDLAKPELTPADSSFISNHYTNLGAFYIHKGDYQRALDHLMQALRFYQDANTDPNLLNNIGEVLNRQKKHQEAIAYYQKSLRISQKNDLQLDGRINALIGLSHGYRELKSYEKAFQYGRQAVNVPTDHRKFIAWSVLGNACLKKGDAQSAIGYLEKAILTYTNDTEATVASPLFGARLAWLQGNAYALLGEENRALAYYQKALIANHTRFEEDNDFSVNPPLSGVIDPLYFLDAIHAKAKTMAAASDELEQKAIALSTYQLCITWIDSLQLRYTSETSQLDWSSKFKPIYEEAIGVAFHLYQNTQAAKYLDFAFAFTEKSKNAILLETLKAKEGQTQVGIPEHLIQQERDLQFNIAFYERELQQAHLQQETEKAKLFQNYLSTARLEWANLNEKLEQDYPKYQAWKYGGESTSIAELQAMLADKNTVLIEYFLGDQFAYAFIITKESATLLPLASPTKIKRSVMDFRAKLLDVDAFKHRPKEAFITYHQKASEVFENILAGPLASCSSDVNTLTIVPDGVLSSIPFAALTNGESVTADLDFGLLPYLLFDYQFAYAYSVDLLSKNNQRQSQLIHNQQLLAFAPPYQENSSIAKRGDMDQLRNASGQLAGAARELQEISQYFAGQFDFSPSANEQRFKSIADQFGILHLAMHGVVDEENANFSYLKFSDLTADDKEDNLLFYYEIANMNLAAHLAVLSACETGVGKYEEGEGVYSLARSFMYAGVPSLVMSLWKVSDESTSHLMPYFYQELASNSTKDGALRAAQLAYLKAANLEYRHPFYWSAFVVLGSTDSLESASGGFLWWGLGALLLLSLGWLRFKSKI